MTQIKRKMIIDDHPTGGGEGSSVAVVDYLAPKFQYLKGDFTIDTSIINSSDYVKIEIVIENGVAILEIEFKVATALTSGTSYNIITSNSSAMDELMGVMMHAGVVACGSTNGVMTWDSYQQQPGILVLQPLASVSSGTTIRGMMTIPMDTWERTSVQSGSLSSALIAYPIGSIYISVNSTNPATLFGGSWVQLENRFLLGAGTSYTAGGTGGETKHSHNYGMQFGGYYRAVSLEQNNNAGLINYDQNNNASVVNNGSAISTVSAQLNNSSTASTKNVSSAHYRIIANTSYENNMPPYLVVYMWQRTA